MTYSDQSVETPFGTSDRRSHVREKTGSVSYVELGEDNGGIVLNVSEGGLALQAVLGFNDEQLPNIRFQLGNSKDWIETSGRIAWTNEKVAGVQFLNLSEAARGVIREWILQQSSPVGPPTPNDQRVTSFEAPSFRENVISEPIPQRVARIPADQGKLQAFPSGAKLVQNFDAVKPSATGVAVKSAARNLIFDRPEHFRFVVPPPENKAGAIGLWVAFLGFFAITAIAGGWAERGKVGEFLTSVGGKISGQSVASEDSSGLATTARPPVSEIEIVDVSNQRRRIPFSGPLIGPGQSALPRHDVGRSAPQHDNSAFQQLPLTAPVRPQVAPSPNGSGSDKPPVLSGLPANPGNILPPSSSIGVRGAVPAPPPPPTQVAQQRPRVLQPAHLLRRVEPIFPHNAADHQIEGTVRLHAVVGRDGTVRSLQPISGPELLALPAMNAVRQWRYSPALIDGRTVESEEDISFVFRLPPQ